MSVLETDRLRLRPWRAADVDDLARIYSDPDVFRFLGGPISRRETEAQIERFVRHWEAHGFGLWAAEERTTGRMIGRIGLMLHEDWTESEDKVEVGWTLDRSRWGRGLATEGALASLRYGFDTLQLRRVIKLRRVISITLPHNIASRRVMEKCGLTLQGRTPWRGLEHVWYALDRAVWTARR